ncbi:EscF/YscF/HrpA family type III secretion system needle major subunit [uncultured Thiohalocapsa sp.]|uniref:EscF/YscF/HrpA family type III secretion system needle major subunit n=1 Tax=uncultured Thiohalocapsa sp. TaxID=768990 RepID=UPI0025FE387E|nr:EscF/YscF/HrpA family type III secretion system needle major subunit [uncultured Thiohalocapsa sp.]
MAYDYTAIQNSIGSRVAEMEQKLSADHDMNNASDMFAMQMEMQQWSLAVSTQSTVAKSISDALRGIVQKMG